MRRFTVILSGSIGYTHYHITSVNVEEAAKKATNNYTEDYPQLNEKPEIIYVFKGFCKQDNLPY